MTMQERMFSILEAAVREFVKDEKPVSSAALYKKYNFGIKPARIRTELNDLTKKGFLAQPHTSGGRVPTHKGYEAIAEKALRNLATFKKGLAVRQMLDCQLEGLIEDISDSLHVLGVGYQPRAKEVYKSGLDDLFEQLAIETKRDALEVVKDFEMMDRGMERMLEMVAGDMPRVFIGSSPVTKSRHLSVIADVFEGDEGSFLLMAIGPTRMDYEKVLRQFKALKENHE